MRPPVVEVGGTRVCGVCGLDMREVKAIADARLRVGGSGWSYVCGKHFKQYKCLLGTGCGHVIYGPEQFLTTREEALDVAKRLCPSAFKGGE